MSITAKTLISAHFAIATDNSEYTAPASTKTIIDKFTVTNTDTVARTITINLIPTGSTVGASNLILSAVSIAAGVTFDSTEMRNQILSAGDVISVKASAAAVVVIRASGREIV